MLRPPESPKIQSSVAILENLMLQTKDGRLDINANGTNRVTSQQLLNAGLSPEAIAELDGMDNTKDGFINFDNVKKVINAFVDRLDGAYKEAVAQGKDTVSSARLKEWGLSDSDIALLDKNDGKEDGEIGIEIIRLQRNDSARAIGLSELPHA